MIAVIRNMLAMLTQGSEGTADIAARSRERYRRAGISGMVAALARVVSVAAVLITIPVTLEYLGSDRFSVWMTITSLTALLSFADLGLGNGLLNAVARANAKHQSTEVSLYISSAFLVLGLIAVLGILFGLFAVPAFDWNRLMAVDPTSVSPDELQLVMAVFIICLSVGIPVAIIQKVQLALQLGYLANLWQLLASIVTLAAILLAVHFKASLAILIAAAVATPSVILIVSAYWFWAHQQPQYSPLHSSPRLVYVRELLSAGLIFFIIQVAGTIAFSSDTLIIAHVLGPGAVAQYSVMAKLTDGIVMISALFLTPLWPAYTDAYARRDMAWIRKTLSLSMKATFVITCICSFILLAVSDYVTAAWVGPSVPYSFLLFAIGGLWAVVKATGNALSMFLNGLGWINFQAAAAVVFAALAIATKIPFAGQLGIIGIPIALIASYLIAVAIPFAWQLPKLLAKTKS